MFVPIGFKNVVTDLIYLKQLQFPLKFHQKLYPNPLCRLKIEITAFKIAKSDYGIRPVNKPLCISNTPMVKWVSRHATDLCRSTNK
jgi:hypothetical protein